MNNFTIFWRVYVREQYRKLRFSFRATFSTLFGRANSESWNPHLVYDHGAFWRLLRDVVVLLTTAIRIVFGIVTIVSMLLLVWPAALFRLLTIPLIATARGLRVVWLLRGTDTRELRTELEEAKKRLKEAAHESKNRAGRVQQNPGRSKRPANRVGR